MTSRVYGVSCPVCNAPIGKRCIPGIRGNQQYSLDNHNERFRKAYCDPRSQQIANAATRKNLALHKSQIARREEKFAEKVARKPISPSKVIKETRQYRASGIWKCIAEAYDSRTALVSILDEMFAA